MSLTIFCSFLRVPRGAMGEYIPVERGEGQVTPSGFALRPEGHLDWKRYHLDIQREWRWADYEGHFTTAAISSPELLQDIVGGLRVITDQVALQASQRPMQVLKMLSKRQTAEGGRALYDLHITRCHLHLEAFTGLADDIAAHVTASGLLDLSEWKTASTLAVPTSPDKLAMLARVYPQIRGDQCTVLQLTSLNYIFYLGALAVLKTLQLRTGNPCFAVGEHILRDIHSLASHHWNTVGRANATAIDFLNSALDIEGACTLGHLQGSFRDEVQTQLLAMYNSLVSTAARAEASRAMA